MALLTASRSVCAAMASLKHPSTRAMLPRLLASARAAAPPHASQQAHGSIPYYLPMLPAGQRGAFSTTAAAKVTQPIVLVNIGVGGNYCSLSLTYDSLVDMDRMDLLEELSKSVRFSTKLKNVSLYGCTVWLLPRVAGDEPTFREEAAAVELRAANTVGDLLTTVQWTPSRLLFIRVRLPLSITPAAMLDVSTPESLLASLDRVIPHDARRTGTELLMPEPLTSAPLLSNMTVKAAQKTRTAAAEFMTHLKLTRTSTLTAVARGFTERMKLRSDGHGSSDRLANPLVALQSAPGGGKSVLLDALGVMSMYGLWDADLCPHEGIRNVLNSSVAIPVTYSSGSDVDVATHDANEDTGLALRILFSFFVRPNPDLAFSDLFYRVPKGINVRTEVAIKACLLAAERETGSKRGVVLLVDEIVKVFAAKPDSPLLTLLGTLLNNFSPTQLNVAVSTLNAVRVNALQTDSGRKIVWAPLPALPQATVEALFLTALARSDPSVTALPVAVRIAISDAAGHPRTLQYVQKAMLSLGSACADLEQLRQASLPDVPAPTYTAVVAALRGAAHDLNATNLCSSAPEKTLRQLIAAGTFINTDITEEHVRVVPKLSMLRLLRFAQIVDGEDPSAYKTRAGRCIKAMAAEEGRGTTMKDHSSLIGSRFERFMKQWLRLMSLVRAGEQLTALSLFYAEFPEPSDDGYSIDKRLQTELTLSPVLLKSSEQYFADAVAAEPAMVNRSQLWTFREKNPAFDLLLAAPVTEDARTFSAIAIETRTSDVCANRAHDDLQRKLKLFEQQKSCFAAMQPAPVHVVYVYAAASPVENAAMEQQRLANRGVLLLANAREGEPPSLATVQRALTPTLADSAFLVLNPAAPTQIPSESSSPSRPKADHPES